MNNGQIYLKTFRFSIYRLLLGLAGIIVAALITMAGYYITLPMPTDTNVIVTGISLIVGLIACWLISRYGGYLFKAGQIAMITRGVTEGELPDNVVSEGIAAVKSRFLTVNVYFAITSAISGISNQITRGLNAITGALGGLSGNDDTKNVVQGVGAVISLFISIVLEYVNYCCLGWVFYKKDENAFKSTCDGAVIYFQNWKTMLANAGKVLGMTLLSLILIGGIFFMVFDAVLPQQFMTAAELTDLEMDLTPEDIAIIVRVVLAVVAWLFVHAALVQPYILVSVMRKYIDKARDTQITFDLYDKLCGISGKFKAAFAKSKA
ncbi:MAG: hypothetical protein Q4D04_10935, partial [Clostridia bacterium]|nr:hypothetical protein [Clostridia bacterium]